MQRKSGQKKQHRLKPYARPANNDRESKEEAQPEQKTKTKTAEPLAGTVFVKTQYMQFKGCANFRARILYATLSGKPIRIDDIRGDDERPGLRDFEASFLRLIEKVTNGCQIQINTTGTALKYKPGLLVGGSNLTHECSLERSVGYYIEPLITLAPFGKKPLSITLKGITNEDKDTPVDIIRTVSLPLLKQFGVDGPMELKVKKRGAPPQGGGEVLLQIPIVPALKPINLVDEGKIKRVRGVAYATKSPAQVTNRMVDAARGVLNNFIPDVYIYTDLWKGKDAGNSPGSGISLVAESTTGCLVSACGTAKAGSLPEDLGKDVAMQLCEEVAKGGCVDSMHQAQMLLMMALCPEDVSKIRLGKLAPHTIQCLRLMKQFFGITFKITPDAKSKTVQLSCVGVGFKNLARKTL